MPGAAWAVTPRRSNPSSPFLSELTTGDMRSQGIGVANLKRGGTPFAYATPYSGTVATERIGGTTEGTEVVSEVREEQGAHEEDIWEGVEEDEGEHGTEEDGDLGGEPDDAMYDEDDEMDGSMSK